MTHGRRGVAISCLLGLLLAGCQAPGADGPPQIRYGEEMCASCGMLISEERFSAALTISSGEPMIFDDLVCALRHLATSDALATRVWVHDYDSGRWLEGPQAVFVHTREVPTPMGGGLFAFATQAAAEQFSQATHGTIVPFGWLSSHAGDHALREPPDHVVDHTN